MSGLLQKIHEYFQYDLGNFSAAFAALPFAALAALIYWLIRRSRHKKKLNGSFKTARKQARWNEIIRLLLVFWIAEIACVTLFPIWFWGDVISMFFGAWHWNLRGEYSLSIRWQYIPTLWFMIADPQYFTGDSTLRYILEWAANVVLFVPLGLALPFVMKRPKFWKVTLIGFGCTFFIELVQPFVFREGTADDVINNTLGAVIGYLLYLAMKKLFPKFTQKCKVTVWDETENITRKETIT